MARHAHYINNSIHKPPSHHTHLPHILPITTPTCPIIRVLIILCICNIQ